MAKSGSSSRRNTGAIVILVEQSSGLYLVECKGIDTSNMKSVDFESLIINKDKFKKVAKVFAVYQYSNVEEACEITEDLIAGKAHKKVLKFLKKNLGKNELACAESNLAKNLKAEGINVNYNKMWVEISRGIRLHLHGLVKGSVVEVQNALDVGLGHSLCRSKFADDPNRQDKPIVNSVAIIDTVEKCCNQFSMKQREWYCWHFPELNKIVTDQQMFSKVSYYVGDKDVYAKKCRDSETAKQCLMELEQLVDDEEIANQIHMAALNSMGQHVTDYDLKTVSDFGSVINELYVMKGNLNSYMREKLAIVAPNLSATIGDNLAAKFIAHAGTLSSLAKAPASTIQIIGAEKALFSALKSRGKVKTPKYGFLFNASAVSRADGKNKGRIARFTANKCAMACRMDAYSEDRSGNLGKQFNMEIEDRLIKLADDTFRVKK